MSVRGRGGGVPKTHNDFSWFMRELQLSHRGGTCQERQHAAAELPWQQFLGDMLHCHRLSWSVKVVR